MKKITYLEKFVLKNYVNNKIDILDIGFIDDNDNYLSNNHFHKVLCKKASFNKVIGIDSNIKLLKIFKKQGYRCYYANAENFKLNKKFDLILAGNIIEHLYNLEGFIKSLELHLKDNGKLLIWTPNAYSFINFLAIFFKGKRKINPGHTHWQSMETLIILFNNYNFQITKSIFFNPPLVGSLTNKIAILITRFLSFFRPAFSTSIFVELKQTYKKLK